MSNKTNRAITRRYMHTFEGASLVKKQVRSKPEDSYAVTKKYLHTFERYAWRAHIAIGTDEDRIPRIVKEVVLLYENYILKKYYTKEKHYTLRQYLHNYQRNRKDFTPQVIEEAEKYYTEHGNERIQRMRKMHAIVMGGNTADGMRPRTGQF